jgi:hypothetical protein
MTWKMSSVIAVSFVTASYSSKKASSQVFSSDHASATRSYVVLSTGTPAVLSRLRRSWRFPRVSLRSVGAPSSGGSR